MKGNTLISSNSQFNLELISVPQYLSQELKTHSILFVPEYIFNTEEEIPTRRTITITYSNNIK